MRSIIENLKKSDKFADFIVPVDEKTEFRDATYFLRRDGIFAFAEGYCHEFDRPLVERHVVSHLVFVPQVGEIPDDSKKQLFGRPYENITKGIMITQPLHLFYPLQLKRYLEIDPSLDVAKPVYARYKVLVPVDSFVGHFPHLHSMKTIFERGDGGDRSALRIKKAIHASADLLGISPGQIGISGSLSLGTYESPHDLDVVIYATVKEVRRIVDFIYTLTATREERKVFEFGKFWPLRFWELFGGDRLMICPFFSYRNLDECPLRDFTCEELAKVKLEGRVCDHTHNAYNPTMVILENVKIDDRSYSGNLRLILYHGGERGDYVEGDHVAGDASHVVIRTFKGEGQERKQVEEYEAVLTTSIGDVKKVGD